METICGFRNAYFQLKGYAIFLCSIILLESCSNKLYPNIQEQILSAKDLKPFGRSELNKSHQLELISSAANFGVSFYGTEVQLHASVPVSSGHNYLQYELDGVYQKRVKISDELKSPISIRTQQSGPHTLWIYKATEAHSGPILIEKLSGKKLLVLEHPGAPLIEFIGNSITCGAAADFSEIPCDSGVYLDHHNAYLSYGPSVARALNANFIMNCVSGIGIYRNWNSEGPAMPQVYNKIDFQEGSAQTWDASRYMPKVVSIALGTNDLSDGDGIKPRSPFDSALFVEQYINFIKTVKEKYPVAQVALLSSAMLSGRKRELLENCLTAIKRVIDASCPGKNTTRLYFFKPMKATGCSGHPSVEDHALMTKELLPFFKSLLSD